MLINNIAEKKASENGEM